MRDQRMPESSPADCGSPTTSTEENPLKVSVVLHSFAHNMSENILLSIRNQQEQVDYIHGQETLAEELVSAAMAAALTEACGRRTGQDFEASQVGVQSSGPPPPTSLDVEMDSNGEAPLSNFSTISTLQTSRAAQPRHLPLSQSGLPIAGSLDYPDAPPTTPLLPELVRGRDSFARKLKGGLANEFLPSPPPPTPKEKLGGAEALAGESQAAAVDPRLAFMEDLMLSLSAEGGELAWMDDLARAVESYGRENDQGRGKIEAYAEGLSGEIIDWVTNHQQIEDDDNDLHLLAHRLAETIITSTLNEVKMAV